MTKKLKGENNGEELSWERRGGGRAEVKKQKQKQKGEWWSHTTTRVPNKNKLNLIVLIYIPE